MARSDDVVTVGVHEFPGEVLVEVTRRDDDGYLVVRSFQFETCEEGLVPAEPVPDDVDDVVSDALSEEGYELSTA
jgi:hypothetical protein